MKIHRFIEKFEGQGSYKIVSVERYNQIVNVLRLTVGAQIIVVDGKGSEGKAEITKIGNSTIEIHIRDVVQKIDYLREVYLFCNILKNDNFELVVQKATELGVVSIIPITTERTVKLNLNRTRLEKIIEEAVEQSGRVTIPTLEDSANFINAIEYAKKFDEIIMFEQHIQNDTMNIKSNAKIAVFVGPEGGWTNEEIYYGKKNGAHFISLGPTTLRAETAAIIGTYAALNL